MVGSIFLFCIVFAHCCRASNQAAVSLLGQLRRQQVFFDQLAATWMKARSLLRVLVSQLFVDNFMPTCPRP